MGLYTSQDKLLIEFKSMRLRLMNVGVFFVVAFALLWSNVRARSLLPFRRTDIGPSGSSTKDVGGCNIIA